MKRVISILLSAVLIIGCLCACTKESGEELELRYTMDSHYSSADESTVRAFEKLCSAVENAESEVKISSSMVDSVARLFYTCYPLFTLVDSMTPLENNSGFSITYVNDTEEHKALVSQFKEKINEIMTECSFGRVTVNEYVFNVYTYVTQNFTLQSNASSTYDTIISGQGYSSYINSVFEYLVLQGGGKACHVVNYEGASTMLSTVKFNDCWYFFDPAKEISDNAGKALKYFAMNDEDVKQIYSIDKFLYTDGTEIEKIEDNSYEALRNSVSFTYEKSQASVVISDTDEAFIIQFV